MHTLLFTIVEAFTPVESAIINLIMTVKISHLILRLSKFNDFSFWQ